MKIVHNRNFIIGISLVLASFILSPTIVKFMHAIEGHEHFECTAIGQLHLHEVELDCDFEKFNLSPQIYPELIEVPEPLSLVQFKVYSDYYNFLSKYQRLHFSLRGPPTAS